jgi:hypothetical protein
VVQILAVADEGLAKAFADDRKERFGQ